MRGSGKLDCAICWALHARALELESRGLRFSGVVLWPNHRQ